MKKVNNNQYNWDLNDLLKNQTLDELFNEYVKQYKTIIKIYPKFYTTPTNFKKWIKLNNELTKLGNRISNYISNNYHENLTDSYFLGWSQKWSLTNSELGNFLADFDNVVIKHRDLIRSYFDQDPSLKPYQRGFELILRNEPHTLSPEVEKILDKASSADGGVYQAFVTLTDSDLKYQDAIDKNNKKHPIKTATDVFKYLKNPDRALRKSAWMNFHNAYLQFENTLTQTLYYTYLKLNTNAKIFNFKDYVSSSAFDDEVDVNFITSIYKHVKGFKDIYQQYRKRFRILLAHQLKLKPSQIEPWDTSMDLSSKPIQISIEEAKALILECFKPLGEEYLKGINKAFNENWISWLPKENKMTGAYSIGGVKGLDKFYILANYDNTMNGVETIAHELGHSMHSYFSTKCQKVSCEIEIFYAEIASICVETLLLLYLSNKYKKNKALVNFYTDRIFSGFFAATTRQVIFSNFEFKANELINNKQQFDAKTLKKIYLDLITEYEGLNNKAVKKIETEPYNKSLVTILRIPHFYYGSFYVYKYAIGQICGLIMANKIYQGDTKARDSFIKFLSSGSSLSPLKTIRILGIDLTKAKPYNEVKDILKNLLRRFK